MTRKITLLAAFAWLALSLASCSTMSLDMEKSGGLPSVELEGVYPQEVVDACDEVMSKHGYDFVRKRGNKALYERRASQMDYLAWGGWSQSEDELMERVSLTQRPLGSDSMELECQPFFVSDADGRMEDVRKISRLKRGKYQGILNEVKATVGQMVGDFEDVDWD